MKDDEQEPDEKTALIEQKQEDTPALLEKTGDDKPHRIEKTGEDKPPLIEKTGVDNDALIEQTAEDKSRLIKKAGEGIKKVLLFTYCRGGSSFLGSLFDTHPEAIYWYEGLAPFYRQYLWELGTAAFNIWFDIEAGHKVRPILPEESVAIAKYLDGMMSCQLDVMNPVALTHHFMTVSKTTKALRSCAKHIPKCAMNTPAECHTSSVNEKLANKCLVRLEAAHQCYLAHNHTHCADPQLKLYNNRFDCYTPVEKSSICVKKFEKVCNKKRLRATKVHRLSMQSVETLIEKDPEIYIVFYVRDPRGVFVSRETNKHMPLKALCKQMEKDHQLYTELKLKYPMSLHMMRYEDLAIHQEEALHDLFGFIDEPIPETTRKYLASITNAASDGGTYGVKRSDSAKTANAWRQKITKDVYAESRAECAEIIDLLGYEL